MAYMSQVVKACWEERHPGNKDSWKRRREAEEEEERRELERQDAQILQEMRESEGETESDRFQDTSDEEPGEGLTAKVTGKDAAETGSIKGKATKRGGGRTQPRAKA